jgi:tellurite resistance protein TerC
MLQVSLAWWVGTIGLIVGLLALDLWLAAARPHRVGFTEAVAWSVGYIAVAVGFGIVFTAHAGGSYGTEFFAGYLVEKSLSIDNLFVFVVIMAAFRVPEQHQHRALTVGVLLALLLRAVFIALGAALLDLFSVTFLLFGVLLVYTAAQLYRHRDSDPDVQDNVLIRATRRLVPVTPDYHGGRLFTRVDGRRRATPMLIVLVAIGSTDLLFALDSIPAVFGITDQSYIVFTANAFALLGLRALYFLVRGLLDRLVYLSTGLAVILAVIGVKLILHWGHTVDEAVPEIPTAVSLAVIIVILLVTTIASLVRSRRDPAARAHAGALHQTAGTATPPGPG